MKKNYLFLMLLASAILFGIGCSSKTTTEGGATPAAGTSQAAPADAAAPMDPSGTYQLDDPSTGTMATLKVTKAGDQVSYVLNAGVGNAAEMDRNALMTLVSGTKYEDADDACHIYFNFSAGKVELSYGGTYEGCGEIDCAGTYTKK